jgi:hypothetical protein
MCTCKGERAHAHVCVRMSARAMRRTRKIVCVNVCERVRVVCLHGVRCVCVCVCVCGCVGGWVHTCNISILGRSDRQPSRSSFGSHMCMASTSASSTRLSWAGSRETGGDSGRAASVWSRGKHARIRKRHALQTLAHTSASSRETSACSSSWSSSTSNHPPPDVCAAMPTLWRRFRQLAE